MLSIFLLSFLTIAGSQNPDVCPPPENIKPCSCVRESDGRLSIACKNVRSSDELVRATTGMKGTSVNSFLLQESNIGVLPSDIFSKMKIASISIKKSNLTRLGENRNRPPFLGLENSLREIEIAETFVTENSPLLSLFLSHLKKLSLLTLDQNLIPTISNSWFENGPYDLTHLMLSRTNTSAIGSHAFEALEKLQLFTLAGTLLADISREMLPNPAKYLTTLNLRQNKFVTLPSDLFNNMPSLEQVFLENNYLTTIDEMIWARVWSQLEFVFFHGNPLVCDSNIKWIYKYRLPENFGGWCELPSSLRHKDLRNVTLTDLQ